MVRPRVAGPGCGRAFAWTLRFSWWRRPTRGHQARPLPMSDNRFELAGLIRRELAARREMDDAARRGDPRDIIAAADDLSKTARDIDTHLRARGLDEAWGVPEPRQ
jgi:hypothetical protein